MDKIAQNKYCILTFMKTIAVFRTLFYIFVIIHLYLKAKKGLHPLPPEQPS